ncbi:hypothetical protein M23134_06757 [Microscilla marina ATCC 23134]|uniref:Uncharacterized protein n=1 Tax=Microscilla marina ATCC 23134 TaxID=313606 RepID=A1ZWM9_MICM2|nr:hypothetical protein M23134_06757 [Microscilla marina ATCC 23134]
MCILLAVCASCGGTREGGNTENTDTTSSDTTSNTTSNNEGNQQSSDTTSTQVDPSSTGYTGGDEHNGFTADEEYLAPELYKYMQANMKGWALVTPQQWLSNDFKKVIDPSDTLIKYEKSIVVKGDFNGDGKEDCAGFFINKANEARLMVFHKTDDGYEAIKVSDEGKIEGKASLGAGISLQPAGKVKTYDPSKPLILKNEAFNYMLYGKSSKIMYYKDGKYLEVFTSD